jgi:rSAM/selenodomain-associated transferase 1
LPPRIIIFARAPVAGRVKTRLQLAPEKALRLHDVFVRSTLATVATYPDVELSTDTATEAWADLPVRRSVQSGGGLGERLFAAISGGLAAGCPAVLVLGSDSPTLPRSHVDSLLASTSDVALGPAEDGGFWGVCCRKARRDMFDGVEWSTDRTLETTLAALEHVGMSVQLGPTWFDIDEPADLERLDGRGFGWGVD